MPIAIRDHTWEQTDTNVFINVPLKGVKTQKVDIFSTDEYLKVSFPPYLFECFLYAAVDDDSSSAKIGNGMVVFKLTKKSPEIWPELQTNEIENKEALKAKRATAITYAQERSERKEKERAEQKRQDDKYALKEAMKLDSEERERIADVKRSAITEANEDLENWKEEQKLQSEQQKIKEAEERRFREALRKRDKKKSPGKIATDKDTTNGIFEDEVKVQPSEIRQPGKIEVSFTHRDFPTAARESTAGLEEEWLKKQNEARRIRDTEDDNLTEEERNPVWLRDKGNEFFKTGNYQAAINAYSHAIKLQSKLPALYSNRAACHLKLGNCMKCLEDSSTALDLLTPPVPQNAAARVKAHTRRGTAFCQLELYVEGLQDYEAALKLQPDNPQLRDDADRIRNIIQGSEPT
ncbi:unnamed protein product [Owenia fusiformis]|uniref:Dynein axonemal assembly factor 4 n=1 Tax=Owenia fusiformis TaxID=6347 RepID=A0A8J1UWG3_OWEFU|nr:unnamed protein product [Owenia fusiformis]